MLSHWQKASPEALFMVVAGSYARNIKRKEGVQMSTLTNKLRFHMLKQLDRLDVGPFEEYLRVNDVSDGEIIRILDATLSRPESLIIHKNQQRKKRDDFLERLMSLLSDREESVTKFITNKANIINISESLFDNISEFINECDISKSEQDIQIWSHLKRAEEQCDLIVADTFKKLQEKKQHGMLTPYIDVKNKDGVKYSPDAATENNVKYLTLTLNLLAYKFNWFQGDKIVLPNRVSVSESDICKAGIIEALARSWMALEESSMRCILFGGEVIHNQRDKVQEGAKANGIKNSYHFQREESNFEIFDSVACERVRKKSLQNFVEIISNPIARSITSQDFNSVGKLSDGSFINADEILTCSILGDIFCTKIYSDDTLYNGLTLRDWIRGYFTLKHLSDEVLSGNILSTISKQNLSNALTKAGLLDDSANIFIDLVTFGKDSKDLFDCPLIEMEGGGFYLSYFSLIAANVSSLILSIFSSLETEASEKGYKFEEEVVEEITKSLSECKGFKFKRGLEEYEYDAVFILDRRIFILECKNRSLSWHNPVKSYRNKKYLSKTTKQVIRLKNALLEHPEVLLEHFEIDVKEFEVVPIILNCMPFSWKGKFEDVYVTDFSSFSRFFKSPSINLVVAGAKEKSKKSLSKYKQWVGSKPNSSDLLRHLEKPIQLEPYLRSRKASQYWWMANNETGFTVVEYETDMKKYAKEEKRLFSFSISPAKKRLNKIKSKKTMVKESRKKNRR
jgi:predicted amino acid-binding ACT domain protein